MASIGGKKEDWITSTFDYIMNNDTIEPEKLIKNDKTRLSI